MRNERKTNMRRTRVQGNMTSKLNCKLETPSGPERGRVSDSTSELPGQRLVTSLDILSGISQVYLHIQTVTGLSEWYQPHGR